MMFNSFGFVFFMIATLTLLAIFEKSNMLKEKTNLLLFVISLVFYALFDINFLLLLVIVIAYTYVIGKFVKNRKGLLFFGIFVSVLILGVFKYYNFFIDSFFTVIRKERNSILNIVLPVGISFYLFKSISYLVDVYKGKCDIEDSFIDLGLYLSFFPEIVAGPISNPKKLLSQIKTKRTLKASSILEGIQIFFFGLFKKIVIADNISVFVNEVYRIPNIYSTLTVWLCVISYSIEIYMDFSGYSDMAIGVGKMLGIDIETNFNLPYISKNVTEFWKRWHITLSNWLMEYIYIPLGGNRKGKTRQYFNLLLTMAIGGLWHGSSWTFVLWGLLNGLALIVHKIYMSKRNNNKIGTFLSIFATFIFTTFMWIFFRSSSISNSFDIFKKLFAFESGVMYISYWSIIGIVLTFIYDSIMVKRYGANNKYLIQDLSTTKGLLVFFIFVGLTIGLAYTGVNPFIYAAF